MALVLEDESLSVRIKVFMQEQRVNANYSTTAN